MTQDSPDSGDVRLILRTAGPADVPRLTDLVLLAYRPYVGRLGGKPRPMTDDYEQIVRDRHVTVVEHESTVVGMIVLATGPEGFYIDNVAVDPAHQGGGIGRALLAHAETVATREGFDSIFLFTHELMAENIALYQRVGYREYDRRQVGDATLVFLRKSLR